MTVVRLLVGTYPAAGPESPPGTGEGIWTIDLDPATGSLTGRLAVRAQAPSFLAARAGVVLAAGETVPGRVTRYATDDDDGALAEREAVASGGATPCHVLWHPSGRVAYVANYGSGSIAVVALTEGGLGGDVRESRDGRDGRTGDARSEQRFTGGVVQVFEHSGRGPDAGRQEGPHAHSTLIAPGGSHLLAADLGTDEIRRYAIAADGLLSEDGLAAVLPAGTGPRHMAVGPGGHVYVVGELDVTLHVLAWTAGRLEPRQVLPTCATPLRTGHRVLPAHVVVVGGSAVGGSAVGDSVVGDSVAGGPVVGDSAVGGSAVGHPVVEQTVLVSVRGSDVLARFAVHDGGARLVHETDIPVGGGWPRHFAVVGDWAVLALQNADRVVAMRWRDVDGSRPGPGAAGRAGDLGGVLTVPVPACVVLREPRG